MYIIPCEDRNSRLIFLGLANCKKIRKYKKQNSHLKPSLLYPISEAYREDPVEFFFFFPQVCLLGKIELELEKEPKE